MLCSEVVYISRQVRSISCIPLLRIASLSALLSRTSRALSWYASGLLVMYLPRLCAHASACSEPLSLYLSAFLDFAKLSIDGGRGLLATTASSDLGLGRLSALCTPRAIARGSVYTCLTLAQAHFDSAHGSRSGSTFCIRRGSFRLAHLLCSRNLSLCATSMDVTLWPLGELRVSRNDVLSRLQAAGELYAKVDAGAYILPVRDADDGLRSL